MITLEFNATYEPFSREPEYVEVNRQFIESLDLRCEKVILDLACGTGTLTAIIMEHALKRSRHNIQSRTKCRSPLVLALDIEQEAVRLAHHFIYSTRSEELHSVNFVVGSCDDLPLVPGSVDIVIIGNAIQLFGSLDCVFREARRVLCANGRIAFNTAFYAGTFPEGTERFYLRWIQHALNYIRTKAAESGKTGEAAVTRRRDVSKRAFSHPWLSPDEYKLALERTGFFPESFLERRVLLTRHSFETIGSYAGLASVLLSGYPVRLACRALEQSAGPAMADFGVDSIPRLWMEMTARKR